MRFGGVLCLALVCTLSHSATTFSSEPPIPLKKAVRSVSYQAKSSSRFNFNGEYGLWVQIMDGEITVHWITTPADSGFLSVLKDGHKLYDFTTPLSQAHAVTFKRPKFNSVVLRYGGQSNPDDRHVTSIYLKNKRTKAVFSKVDSIYVLGDIHGYFENLVKLLTVANLIDAELNWRGHRKHLVALGDLFDRGFDVTRTLWLLYKLERQAERAGGKVHVLLGNHEIMTFVGDLRYLSGKEKLIATTHNTHYQNMFDVHHSLLGRWLASKPGILKMDKILLAHGGVTPVYTAFSVHSFNDILNSYLNEDIFQYLFNDTLTFSAADSALIANRQAFFFSSNSVFWHRGYVKSDTLQNDLRRVLKHFKSELHVVAHTPVKSIRESYDGQLIAVDLQAPATEMLLLVRNRKKKYQRFKFHPERGLEPLNPALPLLNQN